MDHHLHTVLLNLLKLIVLASNLGGVPVLSLPILKSYFLSCSLKPVLRAFHQTFQQEFVSSPICIKPFKKVPVVKINFLAHSNFFT